MAAIDGLELAAVDRDDRIGEKVQLLAQHNELPADPTDRLAVIFSEVRYRLEIGNQSAPQPYQFDVALGFALQPSARFRLMLKAELKELDSELEKLTLEFAPNLRKQFGVGPLTAATLIVAAGDNPEPLRSEAGLAALCGVNPLPHSLARRHATD